MLGEEGAEDPSLFAKMLNEAGVEDLRYLRKCLANGLFEKVSAGLDV
jgi:hypothetical protein